MKDPREKWELSPCPRVPQRSREGTGSHPNHSPKATSTLPFRPQSPHLSCHHVYLSGTGGAEAGGLQAEGQP